MMMYYEVKSIILSYSYNGNRVKKVLKSIAVYISLCRVSAGIDISVKGSDYDLFI